MSDFTSSAGAGAWIGHHGGGPPSRAPSPNSHNVSMRNLPLITDKPFQCGICYDYLSNSVDDLDEHVMKHKRELADRLDAQTQPAADHQEVSYISQSHAPMVYYASSTHGASQGQVYEYATQSCSTSQQVPHFRDFQTQNSSHPQPQMPTYKSAEKYYANHPALLASPLPSQSSSLTDLYANESLNRPAGNSIPVSTQHDEFNQAPPKRSRHEPHPYEHDENNHHQAGGPDLSEDNTADADPATDQMRDEAEHGPTSFSGAQTSDSMLYHEMQPLKSGNAAASRENDRNSCGTSSASFNSEEGCHSDHESNNADASGMHESDAKPPNIQSLRDSAENDSEKELTSTPEGSSKGVEHAEDASARSDNECTKGLGSHLSKGILGTRIRRSARTHSSRR